MSSLMECSVSDSCLTLLWVDDGVDVEGISACKENCILVFVLQNTMAYWRFADAVFGGVGRWAIAAATGCSRYW